MVAGPSHSEILVWWEACPVDIFAHMQSVMSRCRKSTLLSSDEFYFFSCTLISREDGPSWVKLGPLQQWMASTHVLVFPCVSHDIGKQYMLKYC